MNQKSIVNLLKDFIHRLLLLEGSACGHDIRVDIGEEALFTTGELKRAL